MKTLILTLAMLMAGTVSAETDYLTGAEARALGESYACCIHSESILL